MSIKESLSLTSLNLNWLCKETMIVTKLSIVNTFTNSLIQIHRVEPRQTLRTLIWTRIWFYFALLLFHILEDLLKKEIVIEVEIEIWNRKFKIKIENWDCKSKLQIEIEKWNWKLEIKTKCRFWKLKLDIEHWKTVTNCWHWAFVNIFW